jgi:hypothetical protein
MNRIGIIIPCHRVVNKSGKLGAGGGRKSNGCWIWREAINSNLAYQRRDIALILFVFPVISNFTLWMKKSKYFVKNGALKSYIFGSILNDT